MADVRWVGKALAVAQVTGWTFGGTWEATDTITVKCNTKTLTISAGSTTITTIVDTLVTAYNASTITEFTEMTASRSGDDFVLTGDTAGVPFTVTLTTADTGGAADAQTIEGSTVDVAGVDSTACSGPNWWNVAANWSGGAVPSNGDTIWIDGGPSILYGLDLSAVTPAAIYIIGQFGSRGETFGLPKTNAASYPEYRSDYGVITCSGGTPIVINCRSGRIKLNCGSGQAAVTVYNTGTSVEVDRAALIWKGTSTSNTFEMLAGTAEIAPFGGETAALATLRKSGGSVKCSVGVTTLTTVVNAAGTLSVISNIATSLTMSGGEVTISGSATTASLVITGGTCKYNSSGTITALAVGNGTLDMTGDSSAVTSTATTINPGGVIRDPQGRITHTAIVRGTGVKELRAA